MPDSYQYRQKPFASAIGIRVLIERTIAKSLVDGAFHMDVYVWSAVRLQEKGEGEKTSLRKCIRPLVEDKAPGQDELRAYLSLLVGRLLSTNSSSRFPDTPL